MGRPEGIILLAALDGELLFVAAWFSETQTVMAPGRVAIDVPAADLVRHLVTPLALELQVPVDVKPGSCPNPLSVGSRGVLPAAILGTATFDVTEVDPATVRLEGVAPLRWALEDVAAPFEPFTGKAEAMDCTTEGPDGFLDLTLKFEVTEVVTAMGEAQDGEVVVLTLHGALHDGTPIVGEDVVVIIDRGGIR